ncbi:MAG: D-tyrosyl-tRNA(Tyr) deacylase [Clostridiales bacterium]|nr:D-tyrosyl-tRNA(Tyr) deacylase [Clostridiales bacterium]
MRAVVQRVTSSSVEVGGETIGKIDAGLNVLLGVMDDDTESDALILAGKIARLRIFTDENDKMNLSVTDVGGCVLSISQFTLCADIKKGNRPSFTPSAPPERAKLLYEYFNSCLIENGVSKVETGEFGADMKVSINNDGPVTIIMDTEIWRRT